MTVHFFQVGPKKRKKNMAANGGDAEGAFEEEGVDIVSQLWDEVQSLRGETAQNTAECQELRFLVQELQQQIAAAPTPSVVAPKTPADAAKKPSVEAKTKTPSAKKPYVAPEEEGPAPSHPGPPGTRCEYFTRDGEWRKGKVVSCENRTYLLYDNEHKFEVPGWPEEHVKLLGKKPRYYTVSEKCDGMRDRTWQRCTITVVDREAGTVSLEWHSDGTTSVGFPVSQLRPRKREAATPQQQNV